MNNSQSFITQALEEALKTTQQVLSDQTYLEKIEEAINVLATCYQNKGKSFSCGNGGSMCDAIHFAEELTGRYKKNRRSLPSVAISDPGHSTCVSNDFGYEFIFSRFIDGWGEKGDVLIAISTSGNSPNVINAVESAKQNEMKVIGLLGKDGGKLLELVDTALVVPSFATERIQEVHIKTIHILIEGIERVLFPEHYA